MPIDEPENFGQRGRFLAFAMLSPSYELVPSWRGCQFPSPEIGLLPLYDQALASRYVTGLGGLAQSIPDAIFLAYRI